MSVPVPGEPWRSSRYKPCAAGDPLIVRDACGRLLFKVAVSGPERGSDFAIVRVRWLEDSDSEGVPWPLEDIWHTTGEQVSPWPGGPERIDMATALTRSEYRRSMLRPGGPDDRAG